MSAPLHELRVLDLTEGDGAPFAAMQLGDAGADVIKVEPLGGDWARPLGPPFDHGDGPLFMGMNRNKRSLVVDREHPDGQAIVCRLARNADVLVQSFPRAGDAARLGLDYEMLAASNPRLVYCDLSLLERAGPNADKPATDLTVQGIAGITRYVGERGQEPVRFGSNYAGVTAAMYAVQAILAALYRQRTSGQGQQVQTSYLRALIATQQNYITGFSDPDVAGRGFYTAHLDPPYCGYATCDGRVDFTFNHVRDATAMARFLDALGVREAVERDPRFSGQRLGYEHQEALRPYVEPALKERSSADVLHTLDDLGVMCAPVHDYDSLFHDEGALEQEIVLEVEHPRRGAVRTTGLAWKLMRTPGAVQRAPPLLGEHSDEILAEIGYTAADVRDLRARGVVG